MGNNEQKFSLHIPFVWPSVCHLIYWSVPFSLNNLFTNIICVSHIFVALSNIYTLEIKCCYSFHKMNTRSRPKNSLDWHLWATREISKQWLHSMCGPIEGLIQSGSGKNQKGIKRSVDSTLWSWTENGNVREMYFMVITMGRKDGRNGDLIDTTEKESFK